LELIHLLIIKTYDRGGLSFKLQDVKGLLSKILHVARVVPAAAAMFCGLTFAATAETRTLKIYHVHLNERSEITYKRNGKYLPDGLNKLNKALRDWRRNQPTKMDPRLFDVVWESYKRSGATGYINVIGGYRSAATNSMLRKRSKGVAEKSQHVLGRAMDFYIPGVSLKKLRNAGLQAQAGGVGYYPSSGSPFVHMDVGNIRHWPRLSRGELLAVFPNGKTVHVPTDGKPLPGYELALAASKSRKAGTPQFASGSSGGGKSLLAILFGGGADEEEDTGGGEEVAIAAAQPKPAAKRNVAQPVEPLPLPENPVQPVIVATLPRRDQKDGIEPPRPEADVNAETAPEALAFAVPLPQKKPKFAAVTEQAKVAVAEQTEIAAAIEAANATLAPVQVAVAADPAAEEAAIRSALGQDTQDTAAQTEPFFAGVVPVPSKKPKAPETLLASVAIPESRPIVDGQIVVGDPVAAPVNDEFALAIADAQVPIPSRPDVRAQEAGEIVASVEKAAQPDASLRSTMLDSGAESLVSGVKTTGKASKPKSSDAKPAIKTVAKAPTPKVGKFALSATPVKIANQPIAPEYAQALIRAAPSEVLVAGFTTDGPLNADKFSGKAVNFLRVARFETSN
jgi:uncharacterized protein YcbK (DUF882 family)